MRVDLPRSIISIHTGTPTDIEVEVLNTADTIDGVSVRLVGLDPGWVLTEPPQLALFPDTTGLVNLTVTLPPEFPAGTHELGVEVVSSVSGEVEYATIEIVVAPVTSAEIMLAPTT